jgi:ketosteroid isomerase-like protein
VTEEERNVETVRRSIDALNARDLEGVFECFSEDCVFDGSRVMEGVYRGKENYRRFLEEVLDSLGQLEHRELTVLTDVNRVVVLASVEMAGSASGAPGGGRIGYLYELRDGLIVHQEIHPDGEPLVRSLGIEE